MHETGRSSGSSAGVVLGAILVIGLLILVPFLILFLGVTSTIFDWVPQPSLDTLGVAFGIHFIMMTGFLFVRLGLRATDFSSLTGLLVFSVPLVLLLFPFLYVLLHAIGTLWAEIPNTYEAKASFLLLIAVLVSHLFTYSDD